jgi:hypothetical protein
MSFLLGHPCMLFLTPFLGKRIGWQSCDSLPDLYRKLTEQKSGGYRYSASSQTDLDLGSALVLSDRHLGKTYDLSGPQFPHL